MKKCTAGDGSDSTAAVAAWLQANNKITLANLYLIGEVEDPMAFFLTDWETPLSWPVWGTFQPAVITRGTVTSKIGLEVSALDLTWSPAVGVFTQSVATASPYQLARIGYYDNWKVRVWTVYMPTPGDANTLGCSELFGGRWASVSVQRGKLSIKVNSFLDIVNEYVPLNVIELLNTVAGYTGATPPPGFVNIPQFDVVTGSSVNVVNGDQTSPNPHSILNTNNVSHGYLVFNDGPNATLAGVWAAIAQNTQVVINGQNFNQFELYGNGLPWPPTPGADTFYVSGASPINQQDGDYAGFPYVPSAQSAI